MRVSLQKLSTMYRQADDTLTSSHVVAHAAAKQKRRKQPSLSFMGITNPQKALATARAIEQIPVIRNAPQQTITIGFHFPTQQIAKLLLSQRFPVIIQERWLTGMHLKFGLLQIDETKYKETYLIEINTTEGEEEACRLTHNGGFGSHMFQYFAEAGTELARQFAKTLELKVYTELNHWPTLKFIVAAPAKEKKPAQPKLFDGRVGERGLTKTDLERAIKEIYVDRPGFPYYVYWMAYVNFNYDKYSFRQVNIEGMLVRKALKYAMVGPEYVKLIRKIDFYYRREILQKLAQQAPPRRSNTFGDDYKNVIRKMDLMQATEEKAKTSRRLAVV